MKRLSRLGEVASILNRYAHAVLTRSVALHLMQKAGYTEQEAIFVLEILEGDEVTSDFLAGVDSPLDADLYTEGEANDQDSA